MPAPEGFVAHVDDLRVPDHRLANLPSALLCSTVSRLGWVGSTSRLRRPIPFVLGFPMVPLAVVLDFSLKNKIFKVAKKGRKLVEIGRNYSLKKSFTTIYSLRLTRPGSPWASYGHCPRV